MAYCTNCGEDLKGSSRFCRHCGEKIWHRKKPAGKAVSKQSRRPSGASPDGASQRVSRDVASAKHTPSPHSHGAPGHSRSHSEPAGTPEPAAFKSLSRMEAIRLVAKSASKAIAKSLMISAAVLGPGFVLMLIGMTAIGMIWLFVGAFGLMAWTYRKPWRLGAISCLIPPIAAGICYFLQLYLFGDASPPALLMLGAIGVGMGMGVVRGNAHEVYKDKGSIFAQRTFVYLLVWVAAYAATQFFGMAATNLWAVRGGLISGAFSTAMLAVVSIMLLRRRAAMVSAARGIAVFMIVSLSVIGFGALDATAQSYKEQLASSAFAAAQNSINAFMPSFPDCPLQPRRQRHGANEYQSSADVEFQCKIDDPYDNSNNRIYIMTVRVSTGFDDAGAWNWFENQKNSVINSTGFNFANASIGEQGYVISSSSEGSSYSEFKYRAYGIQTGWSIGVELYARLPPGERQSGFTRQVATGIAANIARNLPNALTGGGGGSANPPPPPPPQPDEPPPPPGDWEPVSPDDAAIPAALVAAVLIAAGVGVSIAQAIAAAMASAFQAGVEMTTQEVMDAIFGGSGRGASEETSERQSRDRPQPPPIINPSDGTAFETNADGQYFAPDGNGDWRWMSRRDALQSAADLRAESQGRDDEMDAHTRETEAMLQRWRVNIEEQNAREREAEERLRRETVNQDAEATQPELPEEERGFWEAIWGNIKSGVGGVVTELRKADDDLRKDPWLAVETLTGSVEEVVDTTLDLGGKLVTGIGTAVVGGGKAAVDVVKNPRILVETVTGSIADVADGAKAVASMSATVASEMARAAKDTYDNPELIGDTLLGMHDDISSAANAVEEAVTDPDFVYQGLKSTTGIQNFQDSLDPNRSLPDRIGQVGMGVMALYGAVTGVQDLASGVSRLGGKLATGTGNLADDAARLAAGAADDFADDAARAAAGKADDLAAASDDVAGVVAGKADEVDDLGRAATRADDAAAAGNMDDAAGMTRTQADDLKTQKQGMAETPETARANQDYAKHLQDASEKPGSTIRPGRADDYLVVEGGAPDVEGYTTVSEKHTQMVADKHGVQIFGRPTTNRAADLIESGRAVAKGELVKNKSINKFDALLGAKSDDLALVGHFKPKKPPGIGSKIPDKLIDEFGGATHVDKKIHDQLLGRYKVRAQEFKDQAAWLEKHADKLEVRNGLVIDKASGKPITGDYDLWDVRGLNGEPLPRAVKEQVIKELVAQKKGQFQHGAHTDWDYTRLGRQAQKGGGQSKFDMSKGIDAKIRGSHGPGPDGEALNVYSGREATRPGMKPDPTSKVYIGDTTNPIVERNLTRPIADRYGVKISRGRGQLSITDADGKPFSREIESRIRDEIADGKYGKVAQENGAVISRQPGDWRITDPGGQEIPESVEKQIRNELENMANPANTIFERKLTRPIADRYGVRISRGGAKLSIADADGKPFSREIENRIRAEIADGKDSKIAEQYLAVISREPGDWQITDPGGQEIPESIEKQIRKELENMANPAARLKK